MNCATNFLIYAILYIISNNNGCFNYIDKNDDYITFIHILKYIYILKKILPCVLKEMVLEFFIFKTVNNKYGQRYDDSAVMVCTILYKQIIRIHFTLAEYAECNADKLNLVLNDTMTASI